MGRKKGIGNHLPSLSYDQALKEAGTPTIISYCEDTCDKVFNAALSNKDNKLNKLLTEASKAPYSGRRRTVLRTFVLSLCLKYD